MLILLASAHRLNSANVRIQVLWIGCADSRVPESVVLACKPGEVFVTRNIAKYVLPPSLAYRTHLTKPLSPHSQVHLHDDSILSVLTYAIAELGVEHVVVVGHSNCGGVAACLNAAHAPPSKPTTPLGRWLAPLTQLAQDMSAGGSAPAPIDLVEESVRAQVEQVVRSEVIQAAWSKNAAVRGHAKLLGVHGWVYDIEKGRVRDLAVSVYEA